MVGVDVVVKTNQDEPSHDASSPEPKSAGPQQDDNDDSSEESEGRIDIPG